MTGMTLVTAPAAEPITLDDARRHLRLDTTEEDDHLLALISAARVWVENYTRRALMTQTWDALWDDFPWCFVVPRPPLQSVVAAEFTYNLGGVATQVPTSAYVVDTDSDPGRVYLAYGESWPTPRTIPNAVRLRFVAGYGVADAVPAPIKHATRLMVSHFYELREPTITGTTITSVPMSVEALLAPYQVPVGF